MGKSTYTFLLILSISTLGFGYCPNGAVRVHLPNGEVDESCDQYGMVLEPEDTKEWYVSQRYDRYYNDYGEDGDPTDELEEDTSWPGQREDFSDKLLR